MNDADLPHLVIGACMNVHRALGPGLPRDAYEECLAVELREMEFDFKRNVPLQFDYRSRRIQTTARLDFVINNLKGNPATDDNTFVRRIYLDIIGRIPTTREAEEFLPPRTPTSVRS
jgi:hypothetical protein